MALQSGPSGSGTHPQSRFAADISLQAIRTQVPALPGALAPLLAPGSQQRRASPATALAPAASPGQRTEATGSSAPLASPQPSPVSQPAPIKARPPLPALQSPAAAAVPAAAAQRTNSLRSIISMSPTLSFQSSAISPGKQRTPIVIQPPAAAAAANSGEKSGGDRKQQQQGPGALSPLMGATPVAVLGHVAVTPPTITTAAGAPVRPSRQQQAAQQQQQFEQFRQEAKDAFEALSGQHAGALGSTLEADRMAAEAADLVSAVDILAIDLARCGRLPRSCCPSPAHAWALWIAGCTRACCWRCWTRMYRSGSRGPSARPGRRSRGWRSELYYS